MDQRTVTFAIGVPRVVGFGKTGDFCLGGKLNRTEDMRLNLQ